MILFVCLLVVVCWCVGFYVLCHMAVEVLSTFNALWSFALFRRITHAVLHRNRFVVGAVLTCSVFGAVAAAACAAHQQRLVCSSKSSGFFFSFFFLCIRNNLKSNKQTFVVCRVWFGL